MRAVLAATLLLLGAASLSACGSEDDATDSVPRSTDAPDCDGGDVRFLQGQPAQLPGGGTGGIGRVSRTDTSDG